MNNVGEILKNARLKKRLTVEEIVNQTNIRSRYIKAMESDQFDELPKGEAYHKAFLRNYAERVDLDVDDVIGLYNQAIHQKKVFQEEGQKENRTEKNWLGGYQNRAVKLVGLIIVLSVAFALYNNSRGNRETLKAKPRINKQPEKKVVVSKGKVEAKEEISEEIPLKSEAVVHDIVRSEPEAKAAPGPFIVLKARALKDVKFDLRLDESEKAAFTLKEGQIEEWRARKKITLTISDAGGVEWIFNNSKPQILGKSGQLIKDIVFSKE